MDGRFCAAAANWVESHGEAAAAALERLEAKDAAYDAAFREFARASERMEADLEEAVAVADKAKVDLAAALERAQAVEEAARRLADVAGPPGTVHSATCRIQQDPHECSCPSELLFRVDQLRTALEGRST